MAVVLLHHAGAGVAEGPCNVRQGNTFFHEQRGVRMSERVKTNAYFLWFYLAWLHHILSNCASRWLLGLGQEQDYASGVDRFCFGAFKRLFEGPMARRPARCGTLD